MYAASHRGEAVFETVAMFCHGYATAQSAQTNGIGNPSAGTRARGTL
jgi:hypothetical protein